MLEERLERVLNVLDTHHAHFFEGLEYAEYTEQPVPEDSRAWSQILISTLTGIPGLARQKGPDLRDGSDVKSANAWCSIDTVRFNGVIKAGTQSHLAGSMAYLDQMPFLFFVMWDYNALSCGERVRVWVVRPQYDVLFRRMAQRWYDQLSRRLIRSTNFQLHPPVNENNDVFANNCGNLSYPLLLEAEWNGRRYEIVRYYPNVLAHGQCANAD